MALALSTRLSALRRVRYCTAAPALYRLSTSSRLLESKTPPSQVELYRSPMATPVRILKTVSVTSASITVLFLPASLFIGNPGMALASKIAVSGTVCAFAAATTGLLHYVTRSYILSLRTAKSDLEKIEAGTADLPKVELEASLLNFFGFPRPVRFTAGDIHYPADKTPFFSFAAHNRRYFVHGELVTPHPVLSKLLPGVDVPRG